MRLKNLSADQLSALQSRVEEALTTATRPTKKIVLRTISAAGHCSPNSAGIENGFLSALKHKQVPLKPKFAALMGEEVEETEEKDDKPTGPQTRINMKGVSMINFDKSGKAKLTFLDGNVESGGKLDESALRSSCNLIEFSA